ncbi:MAG: hypothetical protein AAGI53_17040 [Planctomycetota bacterium]
MSLAVFGSIASAQGILIDDFSTDQNLLFVNPTSGGFVDGSVQGDGLGGGERDVSISGSGFADGDQAEFKAQDGVGTFRSWESSGRSGAHTGGVAFTSLFYRSFADGSVDFPDLSNSSARFDLSNLDRIVIDVVDVVGSVSLTAFIGTEDSSGSTGFVRHARLDVDGPGTIELSLADFNPLFGAAPDLSRAFDISFDFEVDVNESLALGSIRAVPTPGAASVFAIGAVVGSRRRR